MKTYKELLNESKDKYILKLEKDKDGNNVNIVYKNGKKIARAYYYYGEGDDFGVSLINPKGKKKVVYVDEKNQIIDAVKKLEKE